jgi:hypothetical protein
MRCGREVVRRRGTTYVWPSNDVKLDAAPASFPLQYDGPWLSSSPRYAVLHHTTADVPTKQQTPNINHQPSTINHQPSTINHQPSTINHQPSNIKHQTPNTKHQTPHACGQQQVVSVSPVPFTPASTSASASASPSCFCLGHHALWAKQAAYKDAICKHATCKSAHTQLRCRRILLLPPNGL